MPLASASCRLAVLPPAICSSALQSQRPRKNRAMAFIALSLSTAARTLTNCETADTQIAVREPLEIGHACDEFQSVPWHAINLRLGEAQRDIAKAEDDGTSMEEMESKYHSMTCQAKSMYQLTCVCGHDANEHSQKPNDTGPRLSDAIFLEDAGAWMPLHGVCLRKDGADPRMLKKMPKVFHCTERRWRGPRGGLWAELDWSKHPVGWVLMEGAPKELKIEGPLLRPAPRIALSPQPSGGRAGRVCDAAAGASRGQAVAGVSGALLAWRRQVIAGQWGHGVHRGRRSVALRRRVLDVSKAGTSK
eukprot:s327_g6.t2